MKHPVLDLEDALHLLQSISKMTFDSLALYVKLVLTTLAILNCTSIVSSQNELDYGLTTDCGGKSMKTFMFTHSFKTFRIC